MLDDIIERLTESLRTRVLTIFGHAVDRVVMQVPPRLEMGDLATPLALELARVLKKAPRQIAEGLVAGFELPSLVRAVTIEGAGYINFQIDRGAFTSAYLRDVLGKPRPAGERIIVEHTNINPNKAAHIGHLRNAILGDTLVRCLHWLGYEVETQNYIDDTGVQVADVVVGFEHLLGENIEAVRARTTDPDVPFDYFCWDLYSRTTRYYEENPEAIEWQRETLHRMEKHEGASAELAALISRAIVGRHIATALRLGIRYDLLPKESDIIKEHFWERAFALLKQSGAVILETEGKHKDCWVMKLSESPEFEGLAEPDKILVRSNGTVTYVGKDIAYQLWKFGLLDRGFGFRAFHRYEDGKVLWESTSVENTDSAAPQFGRADRVFNVIDIRQAYLQKVVREGLRLLGHRREADRSVHFSYEMVALSQETARTLGFVMRDEDSDRSFVEMSGRKGVGVKADDLITELERKAAEALGAGGGAEPQFPEEERGALARQIAIGALRYFMLKFGRNKVLVFDMAEALAFEGETGPYLQYSTVRAENIFRKMKERGVDSQLESADRLGLDGDLSDDLWELIRMSAETAGVIARSVDSLELSLLTRHAFLIAQKFNSFYHKYPILNEKDEDERQRRTICAEIFRQTMHRLLGLLGIPVPARM